MLCCMSDHAGNFRKQIDPSYKSNRRKTRKPVGYVAFCDWVRETYATVSKPMTEADDIMGIIATKPGNQGKVTIVSDDKDMKTIPGRLYRPMSDELIEVSEADADRYFLTQVLTGDSCGWISRRAWNWTEESRSHPRPPTIMGRR